MKVSLNWLNDYIETGLGAEQTAETLSDLGFPCEGMERVGDDTVIDLEVTSNRGDCLGYIGVARELAAATGKELKVPEVEFDELDKDVAEFASVEIRAPDLCGRYTARIIAEVKVGPSPNWLKKRLEAVGLRSVNNVVDATNYAMMETGQPPHAFDYAKIGQGKIVVRKAVAGERIVSIDGTQCGLDPNMLVIADAQVPVAVAGVMGGLETEVSDSTTTILLEDAYFDPVSVRTTSRKLGLPSEAAFRFERIVDIEMVDWASRRTAQLIVWAAGGRVAKGVVDAYPKPPAQKEVTLRLSRLNKLLGIEVAPEEAKKMLSALSFQPRPDGDSLVCTIPSWRSDIYREVDLVEEVARVHGYAEIPTERKIEIEAVPVDARQKLAASIGTSLGGCGFHEAITVGFVDDSVAGLFTEGDVRQYLSVTDVSRKSANLLRPTLLGSLLAVLQTNVNAKNLPCRVFEIADTFVPAGEDGALPIEETKLALVCDSDLRDLRGAIEVLLNGIDKDAPIVFAPTDLRWAQAGADILVGGKAIGTAGVFSQEVRAKFDFKDLAPCGAEMEFEQLLTLRAGPTKLKPIPRFPAIQRDLSVIVDERVPWSDIVEVVSGEAPDELEDVQFVGVYRGRGVPSESKSVTLSLRFRDEDGTLTHQTVDGLQAGIVQSLATSLGAELRTA